MASHITRSILRQSPIRLPKSSSYICPQCRFYSTPPTPPSSPLLLKLREDLKTAMRAKDTNRLNVLRSVLAEVTNANKTAQPIDSDMKLVSILRKRAAASRTAMDEFKSAGREDLVEKEERQAVVMEEYAGGVETMPEEQVRRAVEKVVEEVKAAAKDGKARMGDVMKVLLGPGGSLEGRNVEKSVVAQVVQKAL